MEHVGHLMKWTEPNRTLQETVGSHTVKETQIVPLTLFLAAVMETSLKIFLFLELVLKSVTA